MLKRAWRLNWKLTVHCKNAQSQCPYLLRVRKASHDPSRRNTYQAHNDEIVADIPRVSLNFPSP